MQILVKTCFMYSDIMSENMKEKVNDLIKEKLNKKEVNYRATEDGAACRELPRRLAC